MTQAPLTTIQSSLSLPVHQACPPRRGYHTWAAVEHMNPVHWAAWKALLLLREAVPLLVLVGLRSGLQASYPQPVTKIGCLNYLPKSSILCSPDPSSFENSRGKATLQ